MDYPIVEIFRSIQGEGFHVGTSCIFIRLAGCPLSCSFCDTNKRAQRTLSEVDIVHEIKMRWPPSTVPYPLLAPSISVITGGEPTLYNLQPLVYKLHEQGYRVHLETNGYAKTSNIDWVTLSPKRALQIPPGVYGHEVKWLVPEWSLKDIQRLKDCGRDHFVQPINKRKTLNYENIRACLSMIDADPSLRLSIQMHKVLGVR